MSTQQISPSLYDDPVIAALCNEALALLGDGVSADQIEACGLSLYMPLGPLAAIDQIGLQRFDDVVHAGHDHGSHDHTCGHSHCGHDQGHTAGAAQASSAHVHDDHGHHRHAHGHAHDHDQNHAHDHDHDHAHDHDHRHAHAHAHEHHDHAHEHHDHSHASHAHHDHAHHDHAATPSGAVSGLRPALGDSAIYVIEKMAHGFGRMGQASGAGFYDYEDGDKLLWDGLRAFTRRNTGISADDIRDRLLYAQALVWQQARRAGATTQAGWGFSSVGNDPQRFIDQAGPAFATRAADLANRFGPRFSPSAPDRVA